MKIGILTQPLHMNYGGILQNYSLQQVLKSLGHDVKTIYYMQTTPYNHYINLYSRFLLKYILRKKVNYKPLTSKEVDYMETYTNQFITKNIALTHKMYWIDKSVQTDYEFDAYIVGSDQVWHPRSFPHIEDLFCRFVQDPKIKKIAYAASFGVDHWLYSKKQTLECAQLAKQFNAVSVREASGITLCNKYLGVNAKRVLDPTMLLKSSEYNTLITSVTKREEKSMIVYFLDITPEKEKIAQYISQKLNLKIVYISNPNMDNKLLSYKKRIALPIEDWLEGYNSSSFVLTDSFHGTVFSIIYNLPFLSIGNIKRGVTRFETILELFQLNDRLLDIDNEIDWIKIDRIINEHINYSTINEIIEKEKEESITFLKESLDN